ncbi:PREDICTED: thioredoxin, mitochondrial-like [Priapulus caudatus]|uniref:Thioredoxin, mitochondrial-like n=1 Tax=Priapulus caudatus TaxID=37621 RepID=A0ABM1E1J0_PRICU|nr:PREDICTED: thioredoxin, mitochondrial-like [Priapulus caudatus]XP_014666062.1 PREDICTED: thioredoxin, mitochondrial-like [Priapulus caudatus]
MALRQAVRVLCQVSRPIGQRIAIRPAPVLNCSQFPIQSTTGVRSVSTSFPRLSIVTIQDEADFKEKVINSKIPVLIDFYADWCGPCKILGPRIEKMVGKEDGKVILAKVNVDTNSELAMEYGVQSVPTVIGMKDGEIQETFIGVKDDDQLKSFIAALVK